MANEVRLKILLKAKEEDDQLAEAYAESQHKRKSNQISLSRKYTRKLRGVKQHDDTVEDEHKTSKLQRKPRPMCKISLEDKIDIVYQCLLGKKS